MTFEEVQKLVLEDEGRRLELKKSTGELKDGMHSACALLNSDGGYLLFGITPKSLKVVGQQVTDATKREIAQAISGLEPAIDVKGLNRVEDLDIPVEALREALINALCHRSYESISGSVSLAIYDDRVEIENPGRLPLDITPDNIKESHDSKPYNPTIAGVLYKTTWLESWGSGVARMVQACKAKNIPEPYYEVRPGGVAIVFRFKDINNESNSNQNCELDCEANCELKLSDRHKVILSILMSDGEKTASWIASQLGLGLRSIQSDLSYLRNNGFIKKASKSTHSAWIVLKKS